VVTRLERVQVKPPAALLACAPEPAVPDGSDQDEVAFFILDLAAAGEDCREKLVAVRSFVEGQP